MTTLFKTIEWVFTAGVITLALGWPLWEDEKKAVSKAGIALVMLLIILALAGVILLTVGAGWVIFDLVD